MNAEEMVTYQIEDRGINNPAVLDACREVPREMFIPDNEKSMAYADSPLPIGCGQTISQPYIVALMTELLQPKPQDRILEIGTGSGYQAAIMAEIVKEVYTIEYVPELAARAKNTLLQLGYDNVSFKTGDGFDGWPEFAPYDGIIVTAAAPTVPHPLQKQLKKGGRIIIPVGLPFDVQYLYVLTRTEEGFSEEENIPVRFVPMVGKIMM